jgi:hypothetical protein
MFKQILISIFLLTSVVWGQIQVYPPNAASVNGSSVPASANVLGSNASSQLVAQTNLNGVTQVATDPSTCTPGTTADIYNTTSLLWKYCSATNVWTVGQSVSGSLKIYGTTNALYLNYDATHVGSLKIDSGGSLYIAASHAIFFYDGTNNYILKLYNANTSTIWLDASAGLTFKIAGMHIANSTAGNNDIAGTVTVTNPATTGVVSFATAYTSAPSCILTPTTNQLATILSYWVTTATGSVTANVGVTPTSSITFNYHCMGSPN